MEPFAFCVLKRKDEKKYRKTMKDLVGEKWHPFAHLFVVELILFWNRNRRGIEWHVFSNQWDWWCYWDSPSPASYRDIEQLLEILYSYAFHRPRSLFYHIVRPLQASADTKTRTSRNSLQFVFEIPPASEMDKLALLTKMVIYYIDLVPVIKLSKFVRVDCGYNSHLISL